MRRLAFVLAAAALAVPAVAQRDPAYAAARAAGQVGEQPDGYLGVVGAASPELRAVVGNINIQRKAKYTQSAAAGGDGGAVRLHQRLQSDPADEAGREVQVAGGRMEDPHGGGPGSRFALRVTALPPSRWGRISRRLTPPYPASRRRVPWRARPSAPFRLPA